MTLLEFCKSFFPKEEIFTEQDGMIAIDIVNLLRLEQAGRDSGRISRCQITPSKILHFAEPEDWEHFCPDRPIGCIVWYWKEPLILSEESTRIMKEFSLVIDPGVAGMDFNVRRPYFRMRGRPVTEEQAFEIIRRTDNFFRHDMDKYDLEDLVGDRWVLDNVLYSPYFWPHPRGWVRPDGVIGTNDITGKYPNEGEFVDSMLPLMLAFPYLDLMIGITDWNEGPDYAWNACYGSGDDDAYDGDPDVFARENYPDFEENIVYGIWLHDRTLELMAPARAREKYAEYRRLYGGPDEDIFRSNYYEENHIHPADFEYLKRCIRSHGLDPEEVLAGYVWDPLKGLRERRDVLRGLVAQCKSETEIRWQKMLEQLPPLAWERLKELDEEQQRAAVTERLVQIWELGWSTLPESVLALRREAQALMKEAGVPDWTQACLCDRFVPGGREALSTPKGSWPDPPAECIKEYVGDTLSEELQGKLFGLLMRMKREWESAPEPGPGKHRKELEHESG